MNTKPELTLDVIDVVVSTLGLDQATRTITPDTLLLDHVPELDSMAIVQLVMEIEERFQIEIDEDEITGEMFESVASLTAVVQDHRQGL